MYPLMCRMRGDVDGRCAAPTTMMSPTTSGVAFNPISSPRRFAGDVDVLPGIDLHLHDAVGAEAGSGSTGLGIQADKLESRRDVENTFLGAIGPIAQAAAQRTGRVPAALALVDIELPEHLAGAGIERHRGAAGARREIKNALHHQRRGLEIGIRHGPQIVRMEIPHRVQRIEIRRVNLVERGIAPTGQIAAIGAPFAIGGVIGLGRQRHQFVRGGFLHRQGRQRLGRQSPQTQDRSRPAHQGAAAREISRHGEPSLNAVSPTNRRLPAKLFSTDAHA